MTPISIGLVDDHPHIRQCIADLLSQEGDCVVAAQFDDGEALLAALGTGLLVDVLLVDVVMRGLSGIETVRRAIALCPALRVVALSMHEDPHIVAGMLGAGAIGYVLKDDPFPDLVAALREAAAGRSSFSRSVATP